MADTATTTKSTTAASILTTPALSTRDPGLVQEWCDVMAGYAKTKNRSHPKLTKYERAKIIGVRAEQLARGATPFVDLTTDSRGQVVFDPIATAERELMARRLPFVVVRRMPDSGRELWRLADLVVTV